MAEPVVLLAGGTGGAKLARGLRDVAGDDLVVVANTGDDVEIHGAYVSPDPDLITFWLADEIDERGWGLRGDSFAVMDALRKLGEDVWFNLGDRDLAICLRRTQRLAEGARPTEVAAELGEPARGARPRAPDDGRARSHAGARARPLDGPSGVPHPRARRRPGAGRHVRGRGQGLPHRRRPRRDLPRPRDRHRPLQPDHLDRPDPRAVGHARGAAAARAPVVAVSPLVQGRVVKGPTAPFMAWAGLSLDAAGIADVYAWVIDGLVTDERTDRLPVLETSVRMSTPRERRDVAVETLRFAAALG